MVITIGMIIVMAAIVVGLAMGGGSLMVLAHPGEFVLIFGIGAGILVIASPISVIKGIIARVIEAFKGGSVPKGAYEEALKILYQFFMLARKEGLLALEDHLNDFAQSSIVRNYPKFIANKKAVLFVTDCLRPIVDGRVKPEDMQKLVDNELKSMHQENHQPSHVIHLLGDSFPAVGICAAVLGIILTMGSIAKGPEYVGYKVAAALSGTFLGVFAAYAFIIPVAALIDANIESEERYYKLIGQSIVSFSLGFAPLMAVEMGRRTLLPAERPSAEALEAELKSIGRG